MLSKLESQINGFLLKYPFTKKIIKRIYQLGMYTISKKIKFEGDIIRVSPKDDYEYFFGYYDKSPWSKDERYIVCLRAKQTYRNPAPQEPADIILIDTKNDYKHEVIKQTSAWNVQQGCMLQWLESEGNNKIIFNDYRGEEYCSVIYDIFTKEENVINRPIYDVSKNGKIGLSLDFTRLHKLRPGYGYGYKVDKTSEQRLPTKPAIYLIDLERNTSTGLISYEDLYNFQQRDEMIGAIHGVNHIMLNPSGDRFMFLHRWIKNNKKYSRLLTVNIDGNELFNLSDDNMVSHSFWKNDGVILTYARKKEIGDGYFLLKDKTMEYEHVLKSLTVDGHPSYSPNDKFIITDTYPNRARNQSLILVDDDSVKTIGKFFAPFKYDNDVRCDLHPRWDRKSEKIAFDSVFEGKRGLYIINVEL